MLTWMMSTCVKFHWNPSTQYKDIALDEIDVNGLTEDPKSQYLSWSIVSVGGIKPYFDSSEALKRLSSEGKSTFLCLKDQGYQRQRPCDIAIYLYCILFLTFFISLFVCLFVCLFVSFYLSEIRGKYCLVICKAPCKSNSQMPELSR